MLAGIGRGFRGGIRVSALIAAALAVMAGEAGAQVIDGDEPNYRSFRASVEVADGTEATIYAGGRVKSERGYLALDIAEYATRSYSSSSYESAEPAFASNRRIRGRLGSLGKANLTFQPTGPAVTRRYMCVEYTVRPGVLVGSLGFQGEGGYVDVDESRLEAKRYVIDPKKCSPFDNDRKPNPEPKPTAQLTACSGGFNGPSWQATRMPNGKTTFVGFGRYYRQGDLAKSSFVYRKTRPGAFTFAEDLSTATIAPPEPFAGTGEYELGAVTGDLRWVAPNGDINDMTTIDALLARSDRRACAVFFGQPAAAASSARTHRRAGPPGLSLTRALALRHALP
jgi:hypothetical protein